MACSFARSAPPLPATALAAFPRPQVAAPRRFQFCIERLQDVRQLFLVGLVGWYGCQLCVRRVACFQRIIWYISFNLCYTLDLTVRAFARRRHGSPRASRIAAARRLDSDWIRSRLDPPDGNSWVAWLSRVFRSREVDEAGIPRLLVFGRKMPTFRARCLALRPLRARGQGRAGPRRKATLSESFCSGRSLNFYHDCKEELAKGASSILVCAR